ncbi:MAG: hypothetical protein R3B13_11510 [Polyangiaceae bacterium]
MRRWSSLAAVLALGCTPPPQGSSHPTGAAEDPPPPVVASPVPSENRPELAESPAASPVPVTIDGAREGDVVQRFLDAGLGAALCDTDPIQERTRRIWFFAPCRSAVAVPGGGAVVLYSTPERDPNTARVEAIAWAFAQPTGLEFPARIGQSQQDIESTLGAGTRLFDFKDVVDDGADIVAYSHRADVYVLVRHDAKSSESTGRVWAFVVGRMGRERDAEEWRGLVANLLRTEQRATP